MTWKDKMVLAVLVKQRDFSKVSSDSEKNILRSVFFEGAYDAFCLAIALLRCPLSILIEEYNLIENGK